MRKPALPVPSLVPGVWLNPVAVAEAAFPGKRAKTKRAKRHKITKAKTKKVSKPSKRAATKRVKPSKPRPAAKAPKITLATPPWGAKRVRTLYKLVGTRIRRTREANKVSQHGMARILGVSRTGAGALENRPGREIALHYLLRLAEHWKTPVTTFIPALKELKA